MLSEKINKIRNEAILQIQSAANEDEINAIRVKFLGRKSEFTSILKGLKDLSPDERKSVGQLANSAKREIEEALAQKGQEIKQKSFDFAAEKIDITIPAVKMKRGHLHPLTQIQNELEDIFISLGFEIADGPEVETDFYSFDALNMPPDHPARDKWDTFWIKSDGEQKDKILLRPHTSPVQIRHMENHEPPLRIISPGKCFRNEATDAKHEHTFYQFEALMVGEDVSVANFKFIAEQFFSRFFKKKITVRLRPSFFPFTEPSFEFDISCTVCGGKGCQTCKGGGWLEVGGAGMVNQNVFVSSGYPRGKYQGFAWGFGLERLLMMRNKITDIRFFHSGDIRFIKQF
ncbi:MAG TPA: phenylalanine--tRNA ligase subunit alpha [Candidatus Moranbacteria bacterium]|jgi:phenylalanyl-tRNA synthetase alpha chain|nr:phenylalanine--tRNA ligase subunit alpha [Candidatus Moranbacteria bacterium]HQB59250.1 phenylalanine--tRNA ligase subunit alpha [Candidatus Moranbacteria bacterium]